MTTSARPWILALALAAAWVPRLALAQRGDLEAIPPKWVAVVADDTPMRCGDLDRYYAIARFNAGDLLQVDGQSDEWARVRYPSAVTPFVPAGDARPVGDDQIELTEASGLRAPSLLMGLAGSWKSVYDPPLPAGTRLRIVGVEANAEGETTGYRVAAPAPPGVKTHAHGFVRASGVRNATVTEVERYLATLKGPAPEPAEQPAAAPATPEPDTTEPEATEPEPADVSLLEPMVRPGEEPPASNAPDIVAKVDPPASDADEPADVIEQGGDQGELEAPDQPEAAPVAPRPAEVEGLTAAELKDLEAAFESARKLPREELDVALDELLAEYQRAAHETDEPVVTRALGQRIEWLELRIATRDQRRRLASVMAEVDQREADLQRRVEQWQDSRSFTIVGRLLPSRVYDGVRLPLMYRVESVEPLSYSRTIGYIRPGEGDDLARYTGQVVGIRGLSGFDRELRMTIIEPREVEVLRTGG